ncbi:glycosyltransferase [Rhizobiaceae bacterium n13]|uniref:Glycosyltransferase n=1 Tax=Ferirhizobium litorale TaxID=2927786 RepID=A0AAE3U456_9HYPH|nr:glycosyltransferase [Fererhizobium litorale]MDI7862064.1 glycosyltransferase [Fererhizobium litorale]MDI7922664.1 glycosyltransferase [Fererhizobium litorale]
MQKNVDVAVCTFRRAELEQTLRSIAKLAVPVGVNVRIIVADNDVAPSARERVTALREAVPFEIVYVHCPAANISIARNACLDHATGDYLAFIDDDEVVSEDWLSRLLETARLTQAEVVLGPVRAHYLPEAPGWMQKGDFHSTLPVWVGGEIRTGYTCNVLLKLAAPSLANRRFNLALGKSGGEDTEFFGNAFDAGARIAFASNAWVHETVPEKRASFGWLARRRFRMGQTHGRLLAVNASATSRPRQLVLAIAKSGFCAAACVALGFVPVRRNRYALRAIMHAGVVSGLLGVREIQQYGAVEATS